MGIDSIDRTSGITVQAVIYVLEFVLREAEVLRKSKI